MVLARAVAHPALAVPVLAAGYAGVAGLAVAFVVGYPATLGSGLLMTVRPGRSDGADLVALLAPLPAGGRRIPAAVLAPEAAGGAACRVVCRHGHDRGRRWPD